jgi:hypothetical protein
MIRVISVYSGIEMFVGTMDEVYAFVRVWEMEIVAGEDDWVCVA